MLPYKTLAAKIIINGIENFFSKRVRHIGSKQSAAKRKSYNLRCYCFLKGYERRVKQSRRGYTKHRLSKFLLHLKECVLLYFTAFVVFKDAVTSVAK